MNFHTGKPYVQHGAVIGGGYVTCTSTPPKFSISLSIQYKQRGGDWLVRGTEASEQIPNPRLNIAAYAPECVSGAWRAVASMWEPDAGWYKDTSTETIISC